MDFYALTAYTQEQLEKLFSTSLGTGLQSAEALKRQKLYGLNTFKQAQYRWVTIFLRQLKSPVIYILLLAALLTGLLETMVDATIILIIVVINAFLGFIREYHAEHIASLLQQKLTMNATAVRNGAEQVIDSREIVIGDIILLKAGDLVPADIRLIKVDNILVNESLLTGESAPVEKKSGVLEKPATNIYAASNMVFLGTAVIAGSAKGIVVGTGKQSMFGSIGEISAHTQRVSGFQIKLARMSNWLIALLCVALCSLVLVHFLIKGSSVNFIELILFSVVLALSLIPEALPVITTLCLSRGALRLLQDHMVVKRLSAVEDLGSMTILCTDKTGTLTENKLSVAATKSLKSGYSPVFLSFLASSPDDPFHEALQAALTPEQQFALAEYGQLKTLPFSPELRRNIVLVQDKQQFLLISRGAAEAIFQLCKITTQELQEYQKFIEEQGILGRRVIAIAVKTVAQAPADNLTAFETDMNCAGLIVFEDPIKISAIKAINDIKKMGVMVKMITGDSKEVACSVAQQVGLIRAIDEQCAITGMEFAALSPAQQQAAAHHYTVFARILPQQKYLIVQALREGNVVGFMGEGINDTPALKVAHVGIVVQHGSDVAKDAADIIILRKNLSLIVQGISVGRTVFINTFKYITITLAANIGNFISVAGASLILNFLPLLPLQILLINLLSDFPMLALAADNFDPVDSGHPATYSLKEITISSLCFGALASSFDLLFFFIFSSVLPATLQTNWFIENIITEVILIFSLRTHLPFYKARAPSRLLIVLSILCIVLGIGIPYSSFGKTFFHFVSPAVTHIFIIITLSIACFLATEAAKQYFYRKSPIAPSK